MSVQQMGTMAAAAAASTGLNALITKIPIATTGPGRATVQNSAVKTVHHIQPTDTYEPRRVIHPAARYEARQVVRYNVEPEVTTTTTHKTKMGVQLARPTSTIAGSDQKTTAASKPHVLNNKGSLLDLFI